MTTQRLPKVPLQMLGQSGCLLEFPGCSVLIDPYLSNSVEELDGSDLKRLIAPVASPRDFVNVRWVLITHEHLDHCDPHTVPVLAKASPDTQFMGPQSVINLLLTWGIEQSRLHLAPENIWKQIHAGLNVIAIPTAHPNIERDGNGRSKFVGYIIENQGKRILHIGDTSLNEDIVEHLKKYLPIHTAFLPVNEHNFFRERRGIIGNMSVREAFGLAKEMNFKQVIPVHWDMFELNEVLPEEMQAVYNRMNPDFSLLFKPTSINFNDIKISVIVRTLNESRFLDQLLTSIKKQETVGLGIEVIIVDSGSSDGTLQIAERHGCRVIHITREQFSFGRSLNLGCKAAKGDFLAITSGHCVPTNPYWLQHLVQPLLDGKADYTFGRQLGGEESQFSEKRIFAKYYPKDKSNGQQNFFCNNANAALTYDCWEKYGFNEDLTGLEDLELGQRLVKSGGKVMYVPESVVYHYHNENWAQIQRRFEREALALQHIMPNIHVNIIDLIRYLISSIVKDWLVALSKGVFLKNAKNIFWYRWHQYQGVFKGNNNHRKLSQKEKDKYFFPE